MKNLQTFLTTVYIVGPRALILFIVLNIILKLPTTEAVALALFCFAYDVIQMTRINRLENKVTQLENELKPKNNDTEN